MKRTTKKPLAEITKKITDSKYQINFSSTEDTRKVLEKSNNKNSFKRFNDLELQSLFKYKRKLEMIFKDVFVVFKFEDEYPLTTTILEPDSLEHKTYVRWRHSKTSLSPFLPKIIEFNSSKCEATELNKKRQILHRYYAINKIERRLEQINKILENNSNFNFFLNFDLANFSIDILAEITQLGLVKEGQWIKQAKGRDQSVRNLGRNDALSKVLYEEFAYLAKKLKRIPSFNELFNKLKYISSGDDHEIIVSVDSDYIRWITSRDKTRDTKIKALQSRYTKIKKQYLALNKKSLVLSNTG